MLSKQSDRHTFSYIKFHHVMAKKKSSSKKKTKKISDEQKFDPKILKKAGKTNLGVPAKARKSPKVHKSLLLTHGQQENLQI